MLEDAILFGTVCYNRMKNLTIQCLQASEKFQTGECMRLNCVTGLGFFFFNFSTLNCKSINQKTSINWPLFKSFL